MLLARHAAGVTALMAAYCDLAEDVASWPDRLVVTHGEPGPWNVLRTPAGYIGLFRGPHRDTEDTAESWRNLQHFLRPAERWPQLHLPAS